MGRERTNADFFWNGREAIEVAVPMEEASRTLNPSPPGGGTEPDPKATERRSEALRRGEGLSCPG